MPQHRGIVFGPDTEPWSVLVEPCEDFCTGPMLGRLLQTPGPQNEHKGMVAGKGGSQFPAPSQPKALPSLCVLLHKGPTVPSPLPGKQDPVSRWDVLNGPNQDRRPSGGDSCGDGGCCMDL